MISTICITIALTIATVCGILGMLFACQALIEVKALQKSTHNVEFVPLDSKWASKEADIRKATSRGMDEELPALDDDEVEEESELNLRDLI